MKQIMLKILRVQCNMVAKFYFHQRPNFKPKTYSVSPNDYQDLKTNEALLEIQYQELFEEKDEGCGDMRFHPSLNSELRFRE